MGERAAFLSEGMEVKVESYEGRPIAVKLPLQVTLSVAETDPAVRGQTAAPSYKPAILENGLRVMVPPFIENGSKIIVSTDDVEYIKRAE
jgi:elongation factor P